MGYSDAILLYGKPELTVNEDCLVLYEDEMGFVHYIRNYTTGSEFIVLSHQLWMALPSHMRPISNILIQRDFSALVYFKKLITSHVILSGQLNHFYALFNASMTEFFDSL